MMSVKVNERTMVCPESETPSQSIKLSRLDMVVRMPYSHTSVLYVYPAKDIKNNFASFLDTDFLKWGLSQILVPFYPLTGRLKMNGVDEIVIDCNAKGALFINAETTHELTDLEDSKPNYGELRKMVIPTCDYSKGLSSFPLFMVQFTRFECGGVAMGVASHHHVADGIAHTYIINYCLMYIQGRDIPVAPVFDRSAVHQLAPRNPPQVKFRHLEYEPSLPPLPPNGLTGDKVTTIEGHFSLTKSLIEALKLEATMPVVKANGYMLSTFEVVAAHVWRISCKVRGLANDQSVKLYIPIDARPRLKDDPTMPKWYFGNLVFFTACIAKAGDIIHKPLWYVASKIHKALEKAKDIEYLKSAVDYLESQPEPVVVLRGPESVTSPNLLINSWVHIPFSKADFGWGQPKFLGNGGIKYEGLGFLGPNPNRDGSFLLSINLFKVHKPHFEKCLNELKIIPKI